MASKKYTFKDFLRECKEALKELWIKIWGEDLPKDMTKLYPNEEYTTAEQFKYYEKDKKNLSKRRIKASLLLIIVFLIGFNISKNIFEYIRTSEFVSCFGKDVCIYRGPSLKNQRVNGGIQLKNRNIYLFNEDEYSFFWHKIVVFIQPLIKNFSNIMSWSLYKDLSSLVDQVEQETNLHYLYFDMPYKRYFPDFKKNTVMFYDSNKKTVNVLNEKAIDVKFEKNLQEVIKTANLKAIPYKNEILFIQMGSDVKNKDQKFYNNLIFYNDNIYSLDLENREIKIFSKNFLHSNNNIFNKNLNYGQMYKDHYVILYSIDNNIYELYLFDLENKNIKKLNNFKKPEKYIYHHKANYELKNGNIIMPINNGLYLDYIEVYNPEDDYLVAIEFNTNVLKDNLFDIELENGNILFINKTNSFIFDINTNKFEETNYKETLKNQTNVHKIEKMLLDSTMCKLGIDKNIDRDYSKIQHIDNTKFLIYCGEYYGQIPYIDKTVKYKYTNKTVYYDYKKNIVKKGPNFIYPYIYSRVYPIDKNKLIFIGGEKKLVYIDSNYIKQIPNKNVQILKIKGEK